MLRDRITRDFQIFLELRRAGKSYIAYIRKSDELTGGGGVRYLRYHLHEAGDTVEGSGVTVLDTIPEVINHLRDRVVKWWPVSAAHIITNHTEAFLGVDVMDLMDNELSWISKPLSVERIDDAT